MAMLRLLSKEVTPFLRLSLIIFREFQTEAVKFKCNALSLGDIS